MRAGRAIGAPRPLPAGSMSEHRWRSGRPARNEAGHLRPGAEEQEVGGAAPARQGPPRLPEVGQDVALLRPRLCQRRCVRQGQLHRGQVRPPHHHRRRELLRADQRLPDLRPRGRVEEAHRRGALCRLLPGRPGLGEERERDLGGDHGGGHVPSHRERGEVRGAGRMLEAWLRLRAGQQSEDADGLLGRARDQCRRPRLRLVQARFGQGAREEAGEACGVQEGPPHDGGEAGLQPSLRRVRQVRDHVSVRRELQLRHVQEVLQGGQEDDEGKVEGVVGTASRGEGKGEER
mmetsp:Transcript_9760/g.27539  ORF Transcript_9760/g.27539 Transcript_9760/m.27539 type:complete len:290 (+) Transcript_9760:158-1027(+)